VVHFKLFEKKAFTNEMQLNGTENANNTNACLHIVIFSTDRRTSGAPFGMSTLKYPSNLLIVKRHIILSRNIVNDIFANIIF